MNLVTEFFLLNSPLFPLSGRLYKLLGIGAGPVFLEPLWSKILNGGFLPLKSSEKTLNHSDARGSERIASRIGRIDLRYPIFELRTPNSDIRYPDRPGKLFCHQLFCQDLRHQSFPPRITPIITDKKASTSTSDF